MIVRTCPKCSYVRKPSDDAPDWECPSCGVVYAKASADLASSRRVHEVSRAPAAKEGGGLGVIRIAGLLVIAGVVAVSAVGKFAHKPAPPAQVASAGAEQPGFTAILYSTAWCPYCKATRSLLDKRGVKYIEVDVEKEPNRQEHLKARYHVSGFPILEVGDDIVVGYKPAEIEKLIVNAKHT
jgi:glutaredoxin